jgi:phospholipid/cholesterol/gamma-HCH transport system ATP-binding protein
MPGDSLDPSRGEVEVSKLSFRRGSRVVFDELTCRFPAGRISVVLGGSGAGKTTLLRLIASLERPDTGEIWIDGELEITCVDPEQAQDYRRSVGMMFQGGALLNSMTVFDNVALPMREHSGLSEAEIAERVHAVFASVGLEDVDELLPGQLSGGMTKRAALARALIERPRILLGDEPFSGLDPSTVRLVEALLVQANRRYGPTMILSSHHIQTTLRIADHVVVITEGGAVEGSPEELRRSAHPQVMEFFSEGAGAAA